MSDAEADIQAGQRHEGVPAFPTCGALYSQQERYAGTPGESSGNGYHCNRYLNIFVGFDDGFGVVLFNDSEMVAEPIEDGNGEHDLGGGRPAPCQDGPGMWPGALINDLQASVET